MHKIAVCNTQMKTIAFAKIHAEIPQTIVVPKISYVLLFTFHQNPEYNWINGVVLIILVA